jgi:hypothetical protein
MKKKTANKRISIDRIKNIHMNHQIELATITSIHIKEVENLYIDKVELATTATSYDESTAIPHQSSIPTLTNSQRVLAFYYALKSGGYHSRINVDMAFIVRLMHVAIDKPLTDVHNSEFYKKLKRVPNFKADRGLRKDLEVVRSRLVEAGLKEAVLLVDKEIAMAHQEINNTFK